MLGGIQLGVSVEVLFCESDGRVLGGMQFGVLVRCCFASLTAGATGAWWCWRSCCSGVLFEVLVTV